MFKCVKLKEKAARPERTRWAQHVLPDPLEKVAPFWLR